MREDNEKNIVKIILIVFCIIVIIGGIIFAYFKVIKNKNKTSIDNSANKNYAEEIPLNSNDLNINNTNDSNNSNEIIVESNNTPTNIDNSANNNYAEEIPLNSNDLNINNTNDSNNSNEIIADSNNTPTNNQNEKFLMKIEDVFILHGKGTVVTGRVESGTIRVNDKVQFIGTNNEVKTTVVTKIENFKKNSDVAVAGDNVGLYLKDIQKDEVELGQFLQRVDE